MKGEMPQDEFNHEATLLNPAKYLLLAALAVAMSACGLVVRADDYQKDLAKRNAEMQFVRKQMLAHTQILANHGKMINEARLQIRDALSLVKGSAAGMRKKAAKRPEKKQAPPPKMAAKKPPAAKPSPASRVMFIRRSYRGLPLNYAGGYRAPKGKRVPYTLPPGTRVRTLSGDDRGFTRVEVQTGRWKGRKMWVRSIWLVGRQARPKKWG
jgi:hypothetical protein